LKTKRGESLEVEVFIKGYLKNLVIGPRFKIRAKSEGEPDIVRLRLSVNGWAFLG
jgi:hypothetical protein